MLWWSELANYGQHAIRVWGGHVWVGGACRTHGLGMVGRGPVELSHKAHVTEACCSAGLMGMAEPLFIL